MHMCYTAILPSMLFGPLATTRTHRQSQLLARAIQWWPEQPEAEHTNIVAATTCVYTQNCSQVLPVLFSNFANYYFVPVLISNRQSSISFDWEKCNFNKGIRHILIQRSILRYFFFCFCSRLIRVGCAETSVGNAEKLWPRLKVRDLYSSR